MRIFFASPWQVCIIFGTQSGTTANVAEYMAYKTGLEPIPVGYIEKETFKACGARCSPHRPPADAPAARAQHRWL